jgi:DNA replication protein DnaC
MSKVLIETIKQNLRRLRLSDMAEALDSTLLKAEKERQGYISFLSQLVSAQITARDSRSVERRIKKAGLNKNMTFETYDWNFQPSLNVEHLKDIAELSFIPNGQPVLILGKPGTGKTHIAHAIGIRACEKWYNVDCYKFQALLDKLYATMADDTTDEVIGRLARLDILIIDRVGPIRKKPEHPSLLLDLISACQNRTSIIITSNISFEEWGQAIGNTSIINAIVDRLFHKAHLINFKSGRSYRTEGPEAPEIAVETK